MTTADDIHRRRWLALALLAATQFMVILDASIVNVALPSIGRDLGLSQGGLSWVVNAYMLAFGGFLLLGGRAADLLGRRRVLVSGLLVFAIASLAGGLAQSGAQLIAARAMQGLGAAILAPAALAIVATTFRDGSERVRAMGILAAVGGSGGAAGALLGGLLTDLAGWEWVFLVNVPIGLAAAALAPPLIAESRAEGVARRFDLAGAVSVTAALTVLLVALVGAEDAGLASPRTLALIGASAAVFVAFAWMERRAAWPLVPFRVLRSRSLAGANLALLLGFAGMIAIFFFGSLYMQRGLGYEPLEAGLAFLPLTLGIIVSTTVVSRVVTRLGVRPVMLWGLLLLAAGLAWFGQVSPGGSFAVDILGPSLLAAAGAGMVFITTMVASMSGVAPHEAGLASGLINTSRMVGGALGLAILTTIASARTEQLAVAAGSDPLLTPPALIEGFQAAFLGGACFALAAALAVLVLIPGGVAASHGASRSEARPAEAGAGAG